MIIEIEICFLHLTHPPLRSSGQLLCGTQGPDPDFHMDINRLLVCDRGGNKTPAGNANAAQNSPPKVGPSCCENCRDQCSKKVFFKI